MPLDNFLTLLNFPIHTAKTKKPLIYLGHQFIRMKFSFLRIY